MQRFYNVLFLLFIIFPIQAQITLNHNIGSELINTNSFSCEGDESWSRVFILSDFGIAPDEQFIIRTAQIGLSLSNEGANLSVGVSGVGADFPGPGNLYYPATYFGGSGLGSTPLIQGGPQLMTYNLETPIVVPAGTERILVSFVKRHEIYNPESSVMQVAGTLEDNDTSWYTNDCEDIFIYSPTDELEPPVPNANFYISITGETSSISETSASSTRLSHNVCDDIIKTSIHSCTFASINWARTFTLSDFGISTDEEFIIDTGQVAINNTGWLPEITFNIYEIDNNFPDSFSADNLIGSSQTQTINPFINNNSEIIQVDFENPIIIPADVQRILVEVNKGVAGGDGVAFISGSTLDNDLSWQRGCANVNNIPNYDDSNYYSTEEIGRADARFYINVEGKIRHTFNTFQMNISNICSEFLKEFSVNDISNVSSVAWDFGDPASGTNNTSTDFSPFHDFSEDGTYTITAIVTANYGNVETLTETINVREPPNAFGINNLIQCEDELNTGISSSFDTSSITEQVLGGQVDKLVTYIDGSGNEYDELPKPFTNTIPDLETITVRVAHDDTPCCFSEITFDLVVNRASDTPTILNIIECETNSGSGVAQFNLQEIASSIIGSNTNIEANFYHENGQEILEPLDTVNNIVPYEETITTVITNTETTCSSETSFQLIVESLPISVPLPELIGCDDNNDGISEFFDTSNIESLVLESQPDMLISYFDYSGNQLPNPLPNPYTNSVINEEIITVRVTNNTNSDCFIETPLILKTATQPIINTPTDKHTCDEGNGFGSFDLSNIVTEIIGNQPNLEVLFFDEVGNEIVNLLSISFQNTQAWSQTINVRVVNELNNLCFSETSFNLIVNSLPVLELEDSYYLCSLEPFLYLNVDNGYNSYNWTFEDGTTISNTFEAQLVNAGNYTLTVEQLQNGVLCEKNFDFQFVRSSPPTILEINSQELSSNNNFIEIIATGDGDFEYSIDGVNYQENNYFSNINGGIYNAYVRDRLGCGEDSTEVILIDYPKFFTPNGDGNNDFWQIEGISRYPISEIFIFDRYGKLLKQLSPNTLGWDGTYNGQRLSTNDYWFTADLKNGKKFSGHFTLKL